MLLRSGLALVRASHAAQPDGVPAAARAPRLASGSWTWLAALAAISVAARIPQLLSPNLLLDGDESLVGLMALHVAEGQSLPIYPYGQTYGLSTFEAVAGAVGLLLFGVGPVPLKLAMLALWTIGVLGLAAALARSVGPQRSFWITVVFLLTPAWADTSMRVWGGYTTAFAATGVLIWLVTRDGAGESIARWLVAGALTAVVFLARPFWVPVALPVVGAVLVARRRLSWTAAYLGAALAVIAAVVLATSDVREAWEGPPLGNPALLATLPGVARQIYVNLTGSYFLGAARDAPGPATEMLAILWCAALPLLAALQVYRLATRRYHLLSHLLFLAVCGAIVAPWLLLFARDARYLLPMSAPLVALAGVEFCDLVDRRIVPRRVAVGVAAVLIAAGAVSMVEFRGFNHLWPNPPGAVPESERLHRVLYYLQAKDVRHVFSMNGLLDSQINFYSGERIIARPKTWRVRYPAYANEVNRALRRGRPVAVVGYTDDSGAPGCWDVPICTGGIATLVPNPEAIVTIDNKYFVYVGPDRRLLRRLGFRF